MKSMQSYCAMIFEKLEPRLQLSGAADLVRSTAVLPEIGSDLAAVTAGPRALFAHDTMFSSGPLVDVYDTTTGLSSTTQLPQPLRVFTTTHIGSKAFFAGSAESGGDIGIVDIYDGSAGTWSVGTLPQKGIILSSATLANEAFFVGSNQAGRSFAIVYDDRTHTFSSLPLRKYNSVFAVGVIGTQVIFSSSFDKPMVYDPRMRRFSMLPGRATDPNFVPQVVVGTKAIFKHEGVVDIYDSVLGKWSRSPTPPSVRIGQSYVVVGSKAIFGGFVFDAVTDVVDVYDSVNGQWSTTSLSVARGRVSATSVGNQAIFAGGIIDQDSATTSPPITIPRQVFNTVDIFTDTAPSPVLSGGLTGNIGHRNQVTILNTGDADLAGPYGIRLYASLDRTLNGAILVGTRGVTTPLPAGASATFGVRTILPKDTPAGTYHLLATISDGTGHLTPIAAEDATFRVGGKQAAKPAGIRDAKSRAGAFTRASHSAWQWT